MENCGPHGANLFDSCEQVAIFTMPPNCTSIHQEMDMEIISAWKLKYRLLLLGSILKGVGTRQQKRDYLSALTRGMNGFAEGHDPHMLDVTHMVSKSWEEVTDTTIARCWVKSNVLPVPYSAEL